MTDRHQPTQTTRLPLTRVNCVPNSALDTAHQPHPGSASPLRPAKPSTDRSSHQRTRTHAPKENPVLEALV